MAQPIIQARFQVPPLRTVNLDEVNRWIGHVNRSFSGVADRIGRMPGARGALTTDLDAGGNQFRNLADPTDPDHAVTLGSFDRLVTASLDRLGIAATSESDGGGPGGGTSRATSRRQGQIDNAVNQALANAVPSVAPPEVIDVGAVGSTTDPVIFALSDHTHSGVNLDLGQTVTGLKTFTRAPAAPFAVQAGSDDVVGLGVSFARRALAAFPLVAGLTMSAPPVDYGYRRSMLVMGG